MVYFECYEGEKLIHVCTDLEDPEEMKEYMEDFPERTVKKIEGIFYHHIEILESEDPECWVNCKLVKKINVNDKNIEKLLRIPNVGHGVDPIEGVCKLAFGSIHIPHVLKFDEDIKQRSLFDF